MKESKEEMYKELKTCNDVIEANIIKGHLESEEINCFIANENFSNMLPYMNSMLGGGPKIMVEESDFERAYNLLNEQQDNSSTHKEIVCARCGSKSFGYSLGKNKIKKIFAIIISLFAFVPIANVHFKKTCKNCGEEIDIS